MTVRVRVGFRGRNRCCDPHGLAASPGVKNVLGSATHPSHRMQLAKHLVGALSRRRRFRWEGAFRGAISVRPARSYACLVKPLEYVVTCLANGKYSSRRFELCYCSPTAIKLRTGVTLSCQHDDRPYVMR